MNFFISGFDFSLPICRLFWMGGRRILPDDRKPRIPDPGSNLSSETVSDSYLSTPDELEGDNMRVRKLKSRLITLGINWDVFRKRHG